VYRPCACTAASDGQIWGVGAAGWDTTRGGIAELDPSNGKWVVLCNSSTTRWGFAATPEAVYFTSGTQLLTVARPRHP
jgi:hypothetical protein